MSTENTFRCCVTDGDTLELIPQTDGNVTVAVYENHESSMVSIAREDIPKLISSLQIIYEQGKN